MVQNDAIGGGAEGVRGRLIGAAPYSAYPLLSDRDKAVARQFGVRGWIPMMPVQRVTFVIDTDLTVLEVISSELIMTVHADRALEVLKKRRR